MRNPWKQAAHVSAPAGQAKRGHADSSAFSRFVRPAGGEVYRPVHHGFRVVGCADHASPVASGVGPAGAKNCRSAAGR